MKRTRTLKQSLVVSHVLVSLLPLAFIAVFMLLFLLRSERDDAMVKIAMLAQGTRGQIQLFMDQPLTILQSIEDMLEHAENDNEKTQILNSHTHDSPFFEAIYLLDRNGRVVNVGLPNSRKHYRKDLLGISLGHKREFLKALQSGMPQWSDTFMSLSSEKVSVTLYTPAQDRVVAADINLNALAELIRRLSISDVITMVIDKNGAIIFHPNANLVGSSVMLNDLSLVRMALQGKEETGEFTFLGTTYIGSTSIINPAGWVSLIAESKQRQRKQLIVPLLIFAGGFGGAAVLSLLLAILGSRGLSRPLTELTEKSSVIAQGDYSSILPKSIFTELEQLTSSINSMASAIQQREKQLLEKEMYYRELVENTSNLVLRLDSNVCIVYANHTITRLTGKSVEDTLALSLSSFMPESDWNLMQEKIALWSREQRAGGNHETRIQHENGSLSNLLLSINMHYAPSGTMTDMSIIGHDITVRYQIERQQKEMERQILQSQKMEILGLMAGGVAHDLNNILAGIINYPELMLLQMPDDDPQRPVVASIKKSGERAAAVVADLLTVARNSASVHEAVDINLLLEDCCTSPELENVRQHHPDVRLDFRAEKQLWYCVCSKSHIEKTVMNLLINAFEAVGEQGCVEVETANISPEELAERGVNLEAGEYIAISVKDDGGGIEKDVLDKVFEPFFSKKSLGRSGTGLGLTVAWSSVQEHGGTIKVQSSSEGTMFTVYLPATKERPREKLKTEEKLKYCGHGEHILVVDDEKSIQEIAAKMLELLHYRVSTVNSGEEALEFLENEEVDLLLLDMLMEPGMSGRETYEKICARWPKQRAIIASGYSESKDAEAVLHMGAGAFIKKPYSFDELGSAIAQVLKQRR